MAKLPAKKNLESLRIAVSLVAGRLVAVRRDVREINAEFVESLALVEDRGDRGPE